MLAAPCNVPIRHPRWRRRVAGIVLFCHGWSALHVSMTPGYRIVIEAPVAFGGQTAAGPIVDPAGALAFRPGISTSGGGVPVIAITAPNVAGLSHNQYQRFDVDAAGVILNNSSIAGSSLLGGGVLANSSLQGRPALTILNEVSHAGAPGQLNGPIEVFGAPAAVIIANPNGLVCNGCGVLNTSRFTLTTGIPRWLDVNASTSDFAGTTQLAYDVTRGRIVVDGMGIEGTVGRLDLIGEGLDINAPLRAHYLDGSLSGITLAAGRQRFSLSVDGGVASQGALATATPRPMSWAIDASTLGAMRSGQIHILATEQGLGVNLAASVVAFQGGIHLESAGPVQLQQLTAAGNIQLDSAGNLSVAQTLSAGGNLRIAAAQDTRLAGETHIGGNASIETSGHLAIQAPLRVVNDLTLSARSASTTADVTAGHDYRITASDAITFDGASRAGRDISLTGGHLKLNGVMQAPQVNLDVDSLCLNIGGLGIDGNLDLNLRGDFVLNGSLSVQGDASVRSGGDQHYLSNIQTSGSLALHAGGNLQLDGEVDAGAGMQLSAGGQLRAERSLSAGALDVSAADAHFSGNVAVGGNTRIVVNRLSVLGNVQSGGTLDIHAGAGGIEATDLRSNLDLIISSQGDIALGNADAARDIRLGALNGEIHSGQLIAGRNLSANGESIVVSGIASSTGNFSLTAVSGSLQLDQVLAGGSIEIQATGDVGIAGNLFGANGIALHSGGSLTLEGDAHSARALTLQADSILLNGKLFSGGNALLDAGAGVLSIADVSHVNGTAQLTARGIELSGFRSLAALDLNAGDGGYQNHGDTLVGGDYQARSNGAHQISGNLWIAGNGDIEAAGNILIGAELAVGGSYRAGSGANLSHGGNSLVLGNTLLTSAGTQYLAGSVNSMGELTLEAGDGIRIGQNVHANSKIKLIGGIGGITIGGELASVSDVLLNAAGDLDILGNAYFQQGNLTSREGAILLAGNTHASSLELRATQNIHLDGTSSIDGDLDAQSSHGDIRFGHSLAVNGDFSVQAGANLQLIGNAQLAGQVNLAAAGVIDFQGDTTLAQSLHIDTAGDFINEGRLAVAGNLELNARHIRSNLIRSGGLIAAGHLHANADGVLQLGHLGELTAVEGIDLRAAAFTSAGQIQSGAQLYFNGGSFANSGQIAAESVNLDASLNNSGTLYGNRIDVSGHSSNSGRIAASELNLNSLFNSGLISGNLLNLGATGNLGQISAQDIVIQGGLSNSGTVGASGQLQLDHGHIDNSGALSGNSVQIQTGTLNNSGRLLATSNMQLTLAELNNTLAESRLCVAEPEICAQLPDTRLLTDDDYRWHQTPGEIAAGGQMQITANSLTNQGILRSGGDFFASLDGQFVNQRSLNDPYTDAQFGLDAPAASTGILESGGQIVLQANSVTNSGSLRASQILSVQSSSSFSNTSPLPALVGRIAGSQVLIDAASVLNQGEIIATQGTLKLNSQSDILNQGQHAALSAQTEVRLTASGQINNGTGARLLANDLLHLSANQITNAGVLYGLNAPVLRIELNSAGQISNTSSGSIVAGDWLDLTATAYHNSGVVGSFGDTTLTLPGRWSPAVNALIAKGNFWLNVQGIDVAAGQSWVSDAAWVGWSGALVNYGSVALNTASGHIDNLASGSHHSDGAPPADGAFLLLDSPVVTADAFNWHIEGYDDVDLRAFVNIASFTGSLHNLAADAAVGGEYVYAPVNLAQAVDWVGENAVGEAIHYVGSGLSLPRLFAPGVSHITLVGPSPGTLVADSLVLHGVDLVLPAAADTAADHDRIAKAQATQVTTTAITADTAPPLDATVDPADAVVAPTNPDTLLANTAITPAASGGIGSSPTALTDSRLALPAPSLSTPERGTAALLAGTHSIVPLAWNSMNVIPGSLAAVNLALILSGTFQNRGELAVERDLILHAAQGIDNFGAAIHAGGYLELQGSHFDNRGGSIQADSLFAQFNSHVDNSDGLIRVSEWAGIFSGGDLINDGGRIEAGQLALTVAGNLFNRTLIASVTDSEFSVSTSTPQFDVYGNVYRSNRSLAVTEHHETAGQRARIASTDGDLTLAVGGDLLMQGADLSASGHLLARIAGNVEISALELRQDRHSMETRSSSEQLTPWGESLSFMPVDSSETRIATSEKRTEFLASALHAGSNLVLQAGGDALLLGTDLSSEAAMQLQTAGHLSLGSAVASTQTLARNQVGTTEPVAPDQAFTPYRLAIDELSRESRVGGDIRAGGDFTAQTGEALTLTAADIEAGGDVRLDASRIISGVVTLHNNELHDRESGLSGWFKSGSSETLSAIESVGSRIKAGGNISLLALDTSKLDTPATADPGAVADTALPGLDLSSITLSGQDILLASSGNVGMASASDKHLKDRHNNEQTEVDTHSSVLTRPSVISGTNIHVVGANVAIDASDLTATEKLRVAAAGDLSLGANLDLHDDHTLSIRTRSGFLSTKTRTDESSLQSALARPTALSAAEVALSSVGDLSLYASQISASDGVVTLAAGGDLLAYALQNQEQRQERHETDHRFLGFTYHLRASEDRALTQSAAVASLQSSESLTTESAGDSLFQASRLFAPSVVLRAGVGESAAAEARLLLEAVKETSQVSHTEVQGSLFWQRMAGEGSTTESLAQPNITGTLSLSAPGGVVASLPEGEFKTRLQEQAALPGQAWLTGLTSRDDVQWQRVALAYDHWEYEQEGLSGIAALIIAVVVAIVTQGMGAEVMANLSGTTAVSSGGAVAFTAAEAASVYFPTMTAVAQAGVTSLATQASITLANNKGDLGETLSDLGSSNTVRSIVSSMLTAGTTASFGAEYGVKRLGADTMAGCASGELTGSGCRSGATNATVMSGLTWTSHLMRQDQIANSELAPRLCDAQGNCIGNNTGLSEGVDGDGIKIGGGRINIKEVCTAAPLLCEEDGSNKFKEDLLRSSGDILVPDGKSLPDGSTPLTIDNLVAALPKSPLGGLQGANGLLGMFGITFNYAPGSFADTVVESFAGPHDWLNSTHYYGLDGNILNAPGLWGSEIWNDIDVFFAMPFGLSTLCTQMPGLCGSVQVATSRNRTAPQSSPSVVFTPLNNNILGLINGQFMENSK